MKAYRTAVQSQNLKNTIEILNMYFKCLEVLILCVSGIPNSVIPNFEYGWQFLAFIAL